MQITSVNIAVTALFAQLGLIAISTCVIHHLASWERRDHPISGVLWKGVVFLALLTIGPCLFINELVVISEPLMSSIAPPGVSSEHALAFVIIVDVVFFTSFIRRTGGSTNSPFVPILLTIPALALFLREPHDRVILYLVLTCLGFSRGFWADTYLWRVYFQQPGKTAMWFTSIASLVISTVVGLITAPG